MYIDVSYILVASNYFLNQAHQLDAHLVYRDALPRSVLYVCVCVCMCVSSHMVKCVACTHCKATLGRTIGILFAVLFFKAYV